MARAYGSMLAELLAGVDDEVGLGTDLGGGLTEIEARWLHDREWARGSDDVLKRRSKLGLHLTPDQRAAFDRQWNALFPR